MFINKTINYKTNLQHIPTMKSKSMLSANFVLFFIDKIQFGHEYLNQFPTLQTTRRNYLFRKLY